MELNPDSLPRQFIYKLMIGAIMLRMIFWIATLNEDGRANLAAVPSSSGLSSTSTLTSAG